MSSAWWFQYFGTVWPGSDHFLQRGGVLDGEASLAHLWSRKLWKSPKLWFHKLASAVRDCIMQCSTCRNSFPSKLFTVPSALLQQGGVATEISVLNLQLIQRTRCSRLDNSGGGGLFKIYVFIFLSKGIWKQNPRKSLSAQLAARLVCLLEFRARLGWVRGDHISHW